MIHIIIRKREEKKQFEKQIKIISILKKKLKLKNTVRKFTMSQSGETTL